MRKITLILLLILHLLILSRLNFTAWPEMLAYPYLISHGFILYKDLILPYPPGLIVILSIVFNIFGFNLIVLKILSWSAILCCDILLYLILRRSKLDTFYLTILMLFYICNQSFLDGNQLWFDFATVPFLLVAFFSLLKWLDKRKARWLFLSGLFLGLAVLIKQVAVIYVLSFIIYRCLNNIKKRPMRWRSILNEILILIAGLTLVILPFLIYLLATASFIEFWNWTINYPLTKWSNFPGYLALVVSRSELTILLSLLGPLIFLGVMQKKFYLERSVWLTLTFLVAAVVAVYPRFSYFHLQPTLAFLTIFLALVMLNLKKNQRLQMSVLLLLVVLVVFRVVGRNQLSGGFIFAPDLNLENSIQSLTNTNDRIYLLGLPSSEYVFSKRLPPKNWSDNFGWYLEIPGIQAWVIEGFRETPPKAVFWKIPDIGNWYDLGVYQPKEITEYIKQNYHKDSTINNIEIWIKD